MMISPTSTEHSGVLHPEWEKWIAECLLNLTPTTTVIEVLVQNGIDKSIAIERVSAAVSDPRMTVALSQARQLMKLESVLEVQRSLARLSRNYGSIARMSTPAAADFLEEYYVPNRPVVITGTVDRWDAMWKWTSEYLVKVCGNQIIEVMADRESDVQYEINSERHRQKIRFADYVDMVSAADESNDVYLVANNHFLDEPEARILRDDLAPLPDFLDLNAMDSRVHFWYGPQGTVTPLHHDTMNIFLAQIRGRKLVTLVPPSATPLVYNEVSVYSSVNMEDPDTQAHPLFQSAPQSSVILSPGEALFVPVGWWHHVRALDESISVSFNNFIYPNDYEAIWRHP
jgi:ribosomal protein L16 Arg81 hydroxylase